MGFVKFNDLQMEVWKQQKKDEAERIYKDFGWPEMEGTPAQVVWAKNLKIELYKYFELNKPRISTCDIINNLDMNIEINRLYLKSIESIFNTDVDVNVDVDDMINCLINYKKSWEVIRILKDLVKYNQVGGLIQLYGLYLRDNKVAMTKKLNQIIKDKKFKKEYYN